MMDADQIALVRASLPEVFAPGASAGLVFYDRLFVLAPTLRAIFPEELDDQATRLATAITRAVGLLDDPKALRDAMAGLGISHMKYGLGPEAYDLVGAALLHTVRTRLGEAYTPDMQDAWSAAFAEIAAEMQIGQERSAAE